MAFPLLFSALFRSPALSLNSQLISRPSEAGTAPPESPAREAPSLGACIAAVSL